MKKSLILSIVMTLVLVISMSTATFAWYTANNSATASVSTITANTAAGNLQISSDSGANWSNTATITGDILDPTSPTVAFAGDMAAFKAVNWATGNEGNLTLAAASEVLYGEFWIRNDAAEGLDVTIGITPTGSSDTYSYILYDATNAKIVAGKGYNLTVADGLTKGAAQTITPDAGATTISALNNQTEKVVLQIIVWFDGWDTVNTDQGETVQFALTFNGTATQAQS